MFIVKEKELIGLIAVRDEVKDDAKQVLQILAEMNIETVMLTGDNRDTAMAIAKELGVKPGNVIAEVLPEDKQNYVIQLQNAGKKVAMVGDGVNDAPALQQANLGIAMGSGTDVAMEACDIVLVQNKLFAVTTAINLSKAMMATIKQNLFWAFFYNSLGIPLAAGVLDFNPINFVLMPVWAGAAMGMSSVSVVGNSLRLKWFSG
jgi:P-type Cu+ transporter